MALRRPTGLARGNAPAVISGRVRVDARTKDLTKRLRPGEIAVIDHRDIDRVSGEALVACRPAAVVNAAPSISGHYPNAGPEAIVRAGIPLYDVRRDGLVVEVSDGMPAQIDGDLVRLGRLELTAQELTLEGIEAAMAAAREDLGSELEAFAANTMEYLTKERDLLFDGVGIPDIRTEIAGRHALVVVRGYHYKEDLAALRPYVREYRPVLIGVDGGADALIEAGHQPDLIVGDMDSVSSGALTCGAEVVVHAYRDGRAPGAARVEELGVEPVVFAATGTSEDVAMLLADDKGAELIVAVGTHATLVEFLDKGRSGMSSTFLTRLRVGSKLVDAKGVSRLYRSRITLREILLLLLAGLFALGVALAATPTGRAFLQILAARWDDLIAAITGTVT